jgi:hypothetical protein
MWLGSGRMRSLTGGVCIKLLTKLRHKSSIEVTASRLFRGFRPTRYFTRWPGTKLAKPARFSRDAWIK